MIKKSDNTLKIFITIAAIGMVLWFGGSIMRGIVAYDMFEPTTESMSRKVADPVRAYAGIYYFSSMAVYTAAGFITAFISIIVINIKLRKSIKKLGWLFMVFVLFYFTVPIESIRIWYDVNLSIAIFQDGIKDVSNIAIEEYFFERYESNLLTTIFTLSMMANLTALIYLIWRPLDRNRLKEDIDESKANT